MLSDQLITWSLVSQQPCHGDIYRSTLSSHETATCQSPDMCHMLSVDSSAIAVNDNYTRCV